MAPTTDTFDKQARQQRFLEDPSGARHALPQAGSVTVGSAPGAEGHVQVPGSAADGLDERHCVIGRTKTGGLALKDLGSRAGVRVNGEATSAQRLAVGDLVELGEVKLWVRDGRAEEPEPSLGRLDGYRLLRRLGRGGMGDVVLAVQESLDRQVALKLLKMSLAADAGFVARFQAEAKNAAALSHPHVVHVYDVGEADGRHYLAMEFMEGGTLEARVQAEGPLPVDEVRRVLFETAQALAYAEERGIVHRDIKPENLMLDMTGRVKLADLGLATQTEQRDAQGERVMGTPHFMAPEQARGAAPDPRSDLYALGATAFRLLTGETPFDGETKRDILRAHFTQPVPRPSERMAGLSPVLDDVIMRLLAKEPAERFGSARALIGALSALPSEAAPQPAASKWPLVLAAVAVVGGGAFFALKGGGDEPDEQDPITVADEALGVNGEAVGAGGSGGPGDGLPAIPTVQAAAPEDDEAALEALEDRARAAYRLLVGVADPTERRAMLLAIVQDFPGSSAAAEAHAEIQALDAAAAAANAVEAEAAAYLAAQVGQLDGLVSQAPKLPSGAAADPLQLAFDLLAVPLPAPEPAEISAPFEAARKAHLIELFARASAELARLDEEAEAAATEGDFETYRAKLTEALAYLDQHTIQFTDPDAPPPMPVQAPEPTFDPENPGIGGGAGNPRGLKKVADDVVDSVDDPPTEPEDAPLVFTLDQQERLEAAGLNTFLDRRTSLAERLAGAEQRAIAYHEAQVAADWLDLGAALFAGPSGQSGIGPLVERGDYAGLAETFGALATDLRTEAARENLAKLAFETERAAQVLEDLSAALAAGEWRRASMPHPNGGFEEAIAFTPEGVRFNTDAGERAYSWADYRAGRTAEALPDMYEDVFKNRLERDYTAEELGGIATILRFAAVESALEIADDALVESDRERYFQGDREDVAGLFDVALEWAERADAAAGGDLEVRLTQDERTAALWLADALVARHEGQPAVAAALVRQVLLERPFSLTALLLSNGRTDLPAR